MAHHSDLLNSIKGKDRETREENIDDLLSFVFQGRAIRRFLVFSEDIFEIVFQFTLVRFTCYFVLIIIAAILIGQGLVSDKYNILIAASTALLIFVTENVNRVCYEKLQSELLQTQSLIDFEKMLIERPHLSGIFSNSIDDSSGDDTYDYALMHLELFEHVYEDIYEGLVHKRYREAWLKFIFYCLSKPVFQKVWQNEKTVSNSYSENFIRFVDYARGYHGNHENFGTRPDHIDRD